MSVDIVSPADAIFRCIENAGMSDNAVSREGDVSRGALSIIRRRREKEGNQGLQMYTRTLLRVAHACGYRIIIATEPGKADADAFELGEETLLSGWDANASNPSARMPAVVHVGHGDGLRATITTNNG